jgi:hypothetical protein
MIPVSKNPKAFIIGRRRQVEWVFSVNRMAVFGNELIGQNCPGLIALSP